MNTTALETKYLFLDHLSTLSDWKNFGEVYNLINNYFWIKLKQRFKIIKLSDILNLKWVEALENLTFTRQELDGILLKLPTNVDCDIVRTLVETHEADVNVVSVPLENTPLNLYIHSLPISLVLLSNGADPNIANRDGFAPIHKAKILAQLRLLVKYNADVNITSRRSSVLLLWACYNLFDGVSFLIESGARLYPIEQENLNDNKEVSKPMKDLLKTILD